jgi:hypothetical protein
VVTLQAFRNFCFWTNLHRDARIMPSWGLVPLVPCVRTVVAVVPFRALVTEVRWHGYEAVTGLIEHGGGVWSPRPGSIT